jgi:hypothetical protein
MFYLHLSFRCDKKEKMVWSFLIIAGIIGIFFLFQGPVHKPGHWMSDFKGSLEGALKPEHLPERLICFVILAGYIPSSYTIFHQSFQTKKRHERRKTSAVPAPDDHF